MSFPIGINKVRSIQDIVKKKQKDTEQIKLQTFKLIYKSLLLLLDQYLETDVLCPIYIYD